MNIDKNACDNPSKYGDFRRSFFIILLNLIFVFQVVAVIAANETGKSTIHSFSSFLNRSALNNAGSIHLPASHNGPNFIMEASVQTEENTDSPTHVFDFKAVDAYNIHESFVSLLNKCLLKLPALFFQRKNSIPLFILFHSWKNYLA